jgi:hypothetical protein
VGTSATGGLTALAGVLTSQRQFEMHPRKRALYEKICTLVTAGITGSCDGLKRQYTPDGFLPV